MINFSQLYHVKVRKRFDQEKQISYVEIKIPHNILGDAISNFIAESLVWMLGKERGMEIVHEDNKDRWLL